VFTKKHRTKNWISNFQPKNLERHHASTWIRVELNRPVEPHLEKYESLPLMCLKYNEGSLKTQFNNANYHKLVKVLKFSTTKMQCAHDNQEIFCWVVMWAQRVGKKMDK